MSFSKIAGVVLGSAALVAGHGYVSGAVVDGTYYGGYLVTQYPYESSPPDTIGWSDTATDLGYVDGSSYASSDIICHKSAKPGAISASVAAGGSVELQWTEWPSSHHGPVITYLANCNGDCSSVDKTTLKFFKIDEGGLIDDTTLPGTWASDNLISNNNSRTVTIPSSIEAGNYVLRHEIIALHSAENSNGAQNYPQCLNLKVTGGGSDSPTGTLGTALYTNTDPGILVNIYQSLSSYTIPGPALYTGAASSSDSTTTAASVAATTTAAAATTTAEAATTAASSSTVASVGVISSASPVSVTPSPSATPIGSPSSIPSFSNSTRLPRPSHGRRPGHGAAPSGRPQFSAPSGTENQASTVTDYATATEYATATVSAQFTDSPNVQTPSADDTVTVTASAGGQVAASSTASASSSDSSSTSSSSSSGSTSSGSSSGSSSSSSGSSSYNSSDWSSYLSSLSAEQFLNLLRQTLKWLVSDKKVHARDLTV